MTTARNELLAKSRADIEMETAEKWADRAEAAIELYNEVPESAGKKAWLVDAVEYGHEALEHAVLSGNSSFAELMMSRMRGLI